MSAQHRLPYVPLAVLFVSILSFVISSSVAIVPLLCQKSVTQKCEHPSQKAISYCLLCSAVSCGLFARILLALPQFVIISLYRCPFAHTQPLRQQHNGGGGGGVGGVTSRYMNNRGLYFRDFSCWLVLYIKTNHVMLSSNFCSHECNHVSLARLYGDEIWQGA